MVSRYALCWKPPASKSDSGKLPSPTVEPNLPFRDRLSTKRSKRPDNAPSTQEILRELICSLLRNLYYAGRRGGARHSRVEQEGEEGTGARSRRDHESALQRRRSREVMEQLARRRMVRRRRGGAHAVHARPADDRLRPPRIEAESFLAEGRPCRR